MTPSSTHAVSGETQIQTLRQLALSGLNRRRLSPALPTREWREQLLTEMPLLVEEGEYVEEMRRAVAPLLKDLPVGEQDFMAWLQELEKTGPGQHDPLFDHLAESATYEEMRWFLGQEVAGEAGFDDLVALTQIRLPPRAKLELARNYWDEMGRGKESAMHGPMLSRLASELGLAQTDPSEIVWESLALSNLLVALAHHRRYAYQSVGALGIVELTAPGRAKKVNAGLERLGIGGRARQYFALHATLDVQHSLAWNREIIAPLVAEAPELGQAIAEGALMRLCAGARCFARYRSELGIEAEKKKSVETNRAS